jgi:tight adherence protein C
MSDKLMMSVLMIAGAGSAFLLVWSLYQMKREVMEATRLDDERRQKIASPLMRLLLAFARPLGVLVRYYTLRAQAVFERTERRSPLLTMHEKARRSLIAAGGPHGIKPDEFLGLVLLCSLLGLGVGLMSMVTTGWTLMLVAGTVCGFFWPIVWLRAQEEKRKTQIFRALPFALDLLTLSVEAGLDFTSALGRIVTKIEGTPLGDELRELLRQIHMGQPRSEALRQMADRVVLEEMGNFTGALIQADELGASIGPILRIQSEQMRVRREQIAEKRAMEAPVKILLPLILFIFPTVFLIILGPVALQILIENKLLPWR